MSIWKMLGLERAAPDAPAETDAVRRIVASLDRLPREQARYLAAFAYILSRVAAADLEVGERESRRMEAIVSRLGALPMDQAVVVVQMAKMQNALFGGTEDFLVTREFNRIADREQKLHLLQCLFAVSAADESISTAEDAQIRQIASELLLEDSDFFAARAGYRQYLAVLQQGGGDGD